MTFYLKVIIKQLPLKRQLFDTEERHSGKKERKQQRPQQWLFPLDGKSHGGMADSKLSAVKHAYSFTR